jgi:predicted outer membrane repeat protein
VVYRNGGTVTSNGYNVVDVPLGTGTDQSGWTARATDKTISDLPVSYVSFRLFSGSPATGIITILPSEYPDVDFYGDPITNGAAAGAVQSTASGSGYILDVTVNNSASGSLDVIPPPDADGFVSGVVTLTATPAAGQYYLAYWLVNGNKADNTNPLQFTITDHTWVQAVFSRLIIVDNFSDASGSATVQGTLRHALTNAENGDIIFLSGVTPGQSVIELTSRLPDITRGITIEGTGVTLTRNTSWTTESTTSQLMYISGSSTVVTISRVWFKDGRATYGAAVYNSGGNLTLESCIFSGNRSGDSGGAIMSYGGPLNVKGCTFYGNSSRNYGGAIYNEDTLTLTGNLFYGNTDNYYPIVSPSGTTSNGYNVVDVPFGTATTQSGWTAHSTDRTIEQLLGSNTASPFVDTAAFAPVSGLGSVIAPSPPEGFPATDFYGNTRTFPGAPGAVK